MADVEGAPGLELDAETMRTLHDAVAGRIIAWVGSLADRPTDATDRADGLIPAALRPPPEDGRPLDDLLDLAMAAADASYDAAGPGYLAYVPGGGLHTAAVAEWLAQSLNRYTGVAGATPAAVALEQSVLRWMCDLFDLPAGSQGLLLSGGSLANLTALAAARTARSPDGVDRAVVYTGEHAHASVHKAARTVGFAHDHIRAVASDAHLRLRPQAVADAIAADRDAGLTPTAIVAAAGTTNAGTIDPLGELADVAAATGTWLHVDGAYGGFFRLTDRGRERLAGIERADSITLDPHKTLFLPYGTGALVVRDAGHLAAAFTAEADYLQDLEEPPDVPDLNRLTPELSREWRGLRVWLPLHLHGVAAFREQLDEKLDLAAWAADELRTDPRLEIIEPELSIVAFRLAGADDAAQLDLLRRINAHQRVLLSSTRIGGEVWLRLAIVSFRTHHDRVAEAVDLIREER